MIRVFGCITQEHDLRLVVLACVLCCLACFTTMSMVHRGIFHGPRGRIPWMTGAGVVFGSGVWTTHFISMLAWRSGLVIGYNASLTAASFALVGISAAVALCVAVADIQRSSRIMVAGVVLGLGASTMHYVGTAAMRADGIVAYNRLFVEASVTTMVICAIMALRCLPKLQRMRGRLLGAGWLTLGVVGLHFTGMSALSIQPEPMPVTSNLIIGSVSLATILLAVSFIIVGLSLLGSILDQYMTRRVLREEGSLRHLAHHDSLTGLPNRLHCNETLAHLAEEAAARRTTLAVLCLDLDRFKQVNDTLGHSAGDALLIQVGARLRSLLRSTDMVARLGGDEFVIIVGPPISTGSAVILARRVVHALTEPFVLDGQQVQIGTSLGIAFGPAHGTTGPVLLRNADLALYQAKREGRGLFRFFEPAMNERVVHRQMLERDLRKGIRDNEIALFYQPLVDARTREVCGFEALARWHHPMHGLLPAETFIPLAEETGLILPLGRWIMETACREAARWAPSLRLAVNVSPLQLGQTDLAGTIRSIVAESGLAPHRLEIEITEPALTRHSEQAVETLAQLKADGVRISLDDFGAGHSSLSCFRRVAFDRVKLDRSLVHSLGEDGDAPRLTRAIISLARSLHLSVTAEGVETAAQLAFLAAETCDELQGYLLGEPVAASDLADLMPPAIATSPA